MSAKVRLKLLSPSEDTRADAVLEISGMAYEGDGAAVSLLIQALSDRSSRIRASAAEGIGSLGAKPSTQAAVAPLISLLGDSDWQTRVSAARALGFIGDRRASGPLVAALRDEYVGVRASAAHALGTAGDAGAMEPLRAVFSDPDEKVRQWAREAVGKIRPAPSPPARAVEADDQGGETAPSCPPSPEIELHDRLSALAREWKRCESDSWAMGCLAWVCILSGIGLPIGLVLHLLNQRTRRRKLHNIEAALTKLRDEFSLETPALLQAAAHAECMADWPGSEREAFLRLIDVDCAVTAPEVVDALRALPPRENVAQLIETARREVGTGNAPTFGRIEALREARYVPALCAGLCDTDYNAVYIRTTCARTLMEIADPSSVDALCRAMVDQSYPVTESPIYGRVRELCAEALGRIGDPTAVGPLCEAAVLSGALQWSDTNWTAEGQSLLHDIVDALVSIGPAGFEALGDAAALHEHGMVVRDCVEQTLRRLGGEGRDFAVRELRSPVPARRLTAVYIVSEWDEPAVWTHLPAMLADSDEEVRLIAAYRVGHHADSLGEQAVGPLCQLILSTDATTETGEKTREAALGALLKVVRTDASLPEKVRDVLRGSGNPAGQRLAELI